ncbi:hypothetical protein JW935_20660 [candidate division KSB1 bacterium]|nr:hypothetical protein [candidate division KSB1 bacterium]
MDKKNCKNYRKYIHYIIDGEPIPVDHPEDIRRHFVTCPSCREHLEELTQTDILVSNLLSTLNERHMETEKLAHFAADKFHGDEKLRIALHIKHCRECQNVVSDIRMLEEEKDLCEKILSNEPVHTHDTFWLRLNHYFQFLNPMLKLSGRYALIGVTAAMFFIYLAIAFKRQPDVKYTRQQQPVNTLPTSDSAAISPPKSLTVKSVAPSPALDRQPPKPDHQLYAANFKPDPYLDEMVGTSVRSEAIRVLSPLPGAKLDNGVVFEWQSNSTVRELVILNNKGDIYKTIAPVSNPQKLAGQPNPGLYYWKLMSDDDLLYIGKFILKP